MSCGEIFADPCGSMDDALAWCGCGDGRHRETGVAAYSPAGRSGVTSAYTFEDRGGIGEPMEEYNEEDDDNPDFGGRNTLMMARSGVSTYEFDGETPALGQKESYIDEDDEAFTRSVDRNNRKRSSSGGGGGGFFANLFGAKEEPKSRYIVEDGEDGLFLERGEDGVDGDVAGRKLEEEEGVFGRLFNKIFNKGDADEQEAALVFNEERRGRSESRGSGAMVEMMSYERPRSKSGASSDRKHVSSFQEEEEDRELEDVDDDGVVDNDFLYSSTRRSDHGSFDSGRSSNGIARFGLGGGDGSLSLESSGSFEGNNTDTSATLMEGGRSDVDVHGSGGGDDFGPNALNVAPPPPPRKSSPFPGIRLHQVVDKSRERSGSVSSQKSTKSDGGAPTPASVSAPISTPTPSTTASFSAPSSSPPDHGPVAPTPAIAVDTTSPVVAPVSPVVARAMGRTSSPMARRRSMGSGKAPRRKHTFDNAVDITAGWDDIYESDAELSGTDLHDSEDEEHFESLRAENATSIQPYSYDWETEDERVPHDQDHNQQKDTHIQNLLQEARKSVLEEENEVTDSHESGEVFSRAASFFGSIFEKKGTTSASSSPPYALSSSSPAAPVVHNGVPTGNGRAEEASTFSFRSIFGRSDSTADASRPISSNSNSNSNNSRNCNSGDNDHDKETNGSGSTADSGRDSDDDESDEGPQSKAVPVENRSTPSKMKEYKVLEYKVTPPLSEPSQGQVEEERIDGKEEDAAENEIPDEG
eukprot:TRINITY_DN568_c0_g1_i1.p1 TRINITY_DN568_c0_g1~~TRINITY_DN568_c0_g1_i1.p1  ORF type:complete len:755 (-),score=207.74 TRINITY_DN568_c0_g1_i1:99-2363(-)